MDVAERRGQEGDVECFEAVPVLDLFAAGEGCVGDSAISILVLLLLCFMFSGGGLFARDCQG